MVDVSSCPFRPPVVLRVRAGARRSVSQGEANDLPRTPSPNSTPPRAAVKRSQSSPPSLRVRPPPPRLPPRLCPPAHLEEHQIAAFYLNPDLGYYLTEERGPISILENVLLNEDFQIPATRDALRVAFPHVFSPPACEYLDQYYEYLGCEVTGFGDLEVADICRNVLSGIIFGNLSAASDSAEGPGEGSSHGTGGGRGPPEASQSPGGGGKCDKNDRDRGRDRGGDQGWESGGGGGRREGSGPTHHGPPPNRFEAPPITVTVPVRTTPPRPANSYAQTHWPHSRHRCHEQATRLASAIYEAYNNLPSLPFTVSASGEMPARSTVLYHATRQVHLASFEDAQIQPGFLPHANFFSPGPSFNLTNTAEQAISHVLHGNPTLRGASDTLTNPIVVLAFEINPESIFTNETTTFVDMGSPLQLLNQESAQWVTNNRRKHGRGVRPVDTNWVVGPFMVPLGRTLDDSTQYLIVDDWTGQGIQPVHVAAVSRRAFGILNESLTHIFVEREISTAAE